MKKIIYLILLLILTSCTEEPKKSEWQLLSEYCEAVHAEFIETYNTQSKLEDAEKLLYPNFKAYRDVLPLSVMGSAKLINTLVNGGDCFTKFEWSGELEWKIDDYIYAGGSCETLKRYLNVAELDYCQQDWNPYYAPRLPIYFADGTRLDYDKHFEEFKADGDLSGFVLFMQLRDLDKKLEKELQALDEQSLSNSTTTTSSTTTTIRDNPPYWENTTVELIEITYSQSNCFAFGRFQISNFYDERPVSLNYESPGIFAQLSPSFNNLTKNDKGWLVYVPIGGPPGPEISIYAIDDAGQYSEYLKFKVPDDAYDCPHDN